MKTIELLAIFLVIGLSMFLILVRQRTWCTIKFRIVLTGSLFILGSIGLYSEQLRDLFDLSKIPFRMIQVPLMIVIVEQLFKGLSKLIHKRDFILYLKASEELIDGKTHPNLKTTDQIFTVILVLLIFTLPVFFGII